MASTQLQPTHSIVESLVSSAWVLTITAFSFLCCIHGKRIDPATGVEFESAFMAQVDVTGYGDALASALSDPIFGLYTDNASAPLNARTGLRQLYKYGLYSHCAYVNKTAGSCTKNAFTYQFQPYAAITNDMLSNYSSYTSTIIHNATFANSSSLGRSSRVAYYLLSLGCILAGISILAGIIAGICRYTPAIPVFSFAPAVATIPVLAGSTIWSTLIKRAGDVNSWTVQPAGIPLGIVVSTGTALQYAWAAFGLLAASIIPHMILYYKYRRN